MIAMSLKQSAEVFGTDLGTIPQVNFRGVTIDSRKRCDNQLFVAIRGERFDGHDYVEAAYQAGAVAALVETKLDCDIPQLVVADCKQAMIQLANYWRHQCNATVIALTGSNGKTTVKEMLFQLLQKEGQTHATQGNFNNDIGVPLTLFGLSTDDTYAVIEMGANHQGEIAALAKIAEPDIVYVNNVAAAHLTGFGTVQGVIDAKGELYAYCQENHSAVFNVDEVASQQWRESCAAQKQLCCSLNSKPDVDLNASWRPDEIGISLTVEYKGQTNAVSLCVLGEHNARNALAAISMAVSAGVEFGSAVNNLSGFSGVEGRLQMLDGPANSRLINDSYNANPTSLEAGIKVLCSLKGDAWLALGDMGELGDEAEALHQKAAKTARELGVEKIFAIGPLSCSASRVFEENGYCSDSIDNMVLVILAQIHEDVNLLIKGSRSAGMERLVEGLLSQQNPEEVHHAS